MVSNACHSQHALTPKHRVQLTFELHPEIMWKRAFNSSEPRWRHGELSSLRQLAWCPCNVDGKSLRNRFNKSANGSCSPLVLRRRLNLGRRDPTTLQTAVSDMHAHAGECRTELATPPRGHVHALFCFVYCLLNTKTLMQFLSLARWTFPRGVGTVDLIVNFSQLSSREAVWDSYVIKDYINTLDLTRTDAMCIQWLQLSPSKLKLRHQRAPERRRPLSQTFNWIERHHPGSLVHNYCSGRAGWRVTDNIRQWQSILSVWQAKYLPFVYFFNFQDFFVCTFSVGNISWMFIGVF